MFGRASILVVAAAAMLMLVGQATAFMGPVPAAGKGTVGGSSVNWQRPHVSRRVEGPLFSQQQRQQQASSSSALWAKKNKESDVIEVDGIVKESLPNAKFRVELMATKAIIVCSTSGKMRKNFVRVLVGDPVKVELSPYDLTRGRITYRSRGPGKDRPGFPQFPIPDAPLSPPSP